MFFVKFSTSLILFWLKGSIEITDKYINVSRVNTILGIIPAGKREERIPIRTIGGCGIHTSFKVLPMIFGIMSILGALGISIENISASVMTAFIGILIFGNGIQTMLVISRPGSDVQVSVPFYEKSKLLDAKDEIDRAFEAYENGRGFNTNNDSVIEHT